MPGYRQYMWSQLGEQQQGGTKLLYLIVSIVLVLSAGMMSGLTLGLMSMDSVDLEIVRQPHWTLVTLLLCNAAALEALPIFLDRLVSPYAAIILSVTVVLLFGEILPQAVCSHYGLAIGSYSAWFVRLLMWCSAPISWPISKALDRLLGEGKTALFRRGQLKALVDLHSQTEGLGGQLASEEIQVIRGALDLTNKTASHAMTALDKCFMLPSDAMCDEATLARVLASGHSRVPVYKAGSRNDILGLILVKELVLLDQHKPVSVTALKMRALPYLRADTAMYDLLKLFKTGRSHMVVLTKPPHADDNEDTLSRMGSQDVAIQMEQAKARVEPFEGDSDSRGNSSDSGSRAPPPPTTGKPSPKRRSEGSINVPDKVPEHEATTGERASSDAGQENGPGMEPAATDEAMDADPEDPVGIITIEDVLEELLQLEIVDETDRFTDNDRTQKVDADAVLQDLPPALRDSLKLRSGVQRTTSGRLAFTAGGQTSVLSGSPGSARKALTSRL